MSPDEESHRFVVLIPARLASTRLPDKPLAEIAGLPMVVRVARQAQKSGAHRCVVAADDVRIVQACEAHGVQAILTRRDHVSGSDRLAEACVLLALTDDEMVINVQGDEPLIEPELINAVAQELHARPDCVMSTAAHAIDETADYHNPNVVKVVLDHRRTALYFSRAPIPWYRDGMAQGDASILPSPRPLRHVGIYGYRAGFLRRFPALQPSPQEVVESLEQLRVLWHGERIAVHLSITVPGGGVDTPQDLERVRRMLSQH
jgi:3-deoxy-manno-octulosonate cytidylyltransferase (CMP-KDO synthetase)